MRNPKAIKLTLYFLSVITLVSFLFGLYFRTIHIDEPILAEQVLSFQNLGFVKAELFDGMGKNWEVRQYHFHKFFILLASFVTKLFSFNIWVLRSISLIFFIGLIFLIFKYYKLEKLRSSLLAAITFSVLLANYTVFEYAFLFRPEVMISALGFFSFLLLYLYIKSNKPWFAVGAGVMAGLAAFTHLNGLSYCIAGGLLLLIFSRWKGAFLFGILAGLVTLLYFFDLNSSAELTAFWDQFSSDPNLTEDDFQVLYAFGKIINEHMRFFWNLPTATFSAVYLLCLIFNFSYFKKEHPTLLWYHFILIAALAAIAQSKTIKYGLVYYPFMILIISISLNRIFTQNIPKSRYAFQIFFFAIYFLTNLGTNFINMSKVSTSTLIEKAQTYSQYLDIENSTIFTTSNFYFNSYQKHTIHLILAYELLHEIYLQSPRSKEGFYNFANERKNDYILLRNLRQNSNILALIEFDNLKEGMINFGYKVILKNGEVVIMKKIVD